MNAIAAPAGVVSAPRPYWNSYVAGIGLGLVLLAAFVLTGRGLGASGAATRIVADVAYQVDAAAHGGTRGLATSAVRKGAYAAQYFKDGAGPLDDFLVYMFVGVIVGGFLSGALDGRVSLATLHGPHTTSARRLALAFGGGVVSAFGARLARGCTSGLALTGGATLAVGGWVFMLAVFAGGYGLAYFLRKEWL